MKTNFNWGDDIIDSRDIIARHEELQDEYNNLLEALEEASIAVDRMRENCETFNQENTKIFERLQEELVEAQEALNEFNSSFDKDELDTLTEVISQGESSPDWSYGETLIREEYFRTYAEELADDTCERPKELDQWPWRHIDWDAAAEELKNDYSQINVDGETYFIRS